VRRDLVSQEQWLKNDLANNAASCTLAFMSAPRFASDSNGGFSYTQAIWQDLYNGGVDVALGGHDHWYERFQPLDANGNYDPNYGVTQFVVGAGSQLQLAVPVRHRWHGHRLRHRPMSRRS
jgi:hypothetical protein